MSAHSDIDQMTTRLRAMTRDGASIEAAQVKLIGLDEIRHAAGPRWPRMRERVRAGSMQILSQHTGPEDVIVPAGDGFLIMLGDGPAGDTQRRCQIMRDALLSFYLGEDALKTLRPAVKNRALNVDGLTDLIAANLRDSEKPVARGLNDEIAFAPVLITHEPKIAAMMSAPVVACGGARRIAYNHDFILDGRHHAPQDFLELDIALLDAALERASQLKADGRAAAIGVAVHSSTLQMRRSREAYFNWLSGIDPDLRRTLFIAISEIERGAPLISISEWTCGLRAYVSRVWLDFHYADHAIGSVGGAGAWAAGFHLPAFAGVQRDDRAHRLRAQTQFWSKTLRSQGMHLIVHGFQEAAFLEEAGSLGVSLLTSDRHWPFEPRTTH